MSYWQRVVCRSGGTDLSLLSKFYSATKHFSKYFFVDLLYQCNFTLAFYVSCICCDYWALNTVSQTGALTFQLATCDLLTFSRLAMNVLMFVSLSISSGWTRELCLNFVLSLFYYLCYMLYFDVGYMFIYLFIIYVC